MWNDRVFRTLLLSAVLICLVGLFRPDAMRTASHEKWFWSWKTHSTHVHDIVVLGDSRVYRGVSPEAMAPLLPGYRIFNFGYSSGSLSPRMLSEAERRLDGQGRRILVLGVTPHALTPNASRDEQYLQEANRTASEVLENIYIAPLTKYFDPTTPIRFAKEFERKRRGAREEFHESGWVAALREVSDPGEGLALYSGVFNGNRVSPELVDRLIRQTETWILEGIRVYAFRPPTLPEMIELERRVSGFEENEFRKRFGQAGGIWIPVSPEGYRIYDGSHLDKESAVRLSAYLAGIIRDHQTRPGRAAAP